MSYIISLPSQTNGYVQRRIDHFVGPLHSSGVSSLFPGKRQVSPSGIRGLVAKVRPEILDAAAIEIIDQVIRENKAAEPLLKKTVGYMRIFAHHWLCSRCCLACCIHAAGLDGEMDSTYIRNEWNMCVRRKDCSRFIGAVARAP